MVFYAVLQIPTDYSSKLYPTSRANVDYDVITSTVDGMV